MGKTRFDALPPVDPACRITLRRQPDCKEHNRKLTRLATVQAAELGTFTPYAHCNCFYNTAVAAAGRVIGVVPPFQRSEWRPLRRIAKLLSRQLPDVEPIHFTEVADLYTGKKRAAYALAAAQLERDGPSRADAAVSAFIKCEKMNPGKVNPDPRMIQPRDRKFTVRLAAHLKPLEHHLYALTGDGKTLPKGRLVGKGMNPKARATRLREMWEGMSDPVAVVLDAHRFDKHVSTELLRLEHSVYRDVDKSRELQSLLDQQLRNRVKTRVGVSYVTRGRRMSGDINTALGNVILMIIMTVRACERAGIPVPDFQILDDGDDIVLLIERKWLQSLLDTVADSFLLFGMVCKVEGVFHRFEDIEWCQSRPIELTPGNWVMVRNPAKALSTTLVGTKYTEERARPKLVQTIGVGESILNAGVPVLQSFAQAILRSSGTDQLIKLDSTDDLYHRLHRAGGINKLHPVDPLPIEDCARASFEKAYGISPQRQIELEAQLDRTTFNIAGGTHQNPIDPSFWPASQEPTQDVYRIGYVPL